MTEFLITPKPPRICLFTMIDKAYERIAEITFPNFAAYCGKHGYKFEVGAYHTDPRKMDTYGDRGKTIVFDKLFNDFDIMMFLDADALVMNSDIRIEDVLGDRPFLWSHHWNGPCSGFWIARNIPKVYVAITEVRNRAPFLGNVRPIHVEGPPSKTVLEMEPHGQSDQETMRTLMTMPPYDEVFGNGNCVSGKEAGHCFDYRAIGWPALGDYLGHYEPGDWLLTFPSIPLERRIELLREAALRAT